MEAITAAIAIFAITAVSGWLLWKAVTSPYRDGVEKKKQRAREQSWGKIKKGGE